MSNSLLESLWARVTANIGDRINQAQELLTQALSADRKSTRLNSSHWNKSRMPSSA